MYLTTNGPNDHNMPANRTTGIAIFSFLSSIINECLIKISLNYNKNSILAKRFYLVGLEKNNLRYPIF